MEKTKITPRKPHFWSGKYKLEWDNTTMPMINLDLQITKNEIALQAFATKNSERAGKVLNGQSTDMEDMLKLCNLYDIDICQFMRMADGSHPVMLSRTEYEELKRAAMGGEMPQSEDEPDSEPSAHDTDTDADVTSDQQTMPRYLNDANVEKLIEMAMSQQRKIEALYERIAELTATVAEQRGGIQKPYRHQSNPQFVADQEG